MSLDGRTAEDEVARKHFVIVGNGLAGHRAALELRRLSARAHISLLGGDFGLPYDRPMLTKDFLLGKIDASMLRLKGTDNYERLGIDYHPATWVEDIDRSGHRISSTAGTFDYDALLIATGSRPRELPGAPASETIFYIRTLGDAERLRAALGPRRSIVIIGGGFIGLEVASSARELGCEVTVIEAQDRLVPRAAPRFVGDFLLARHRARGVRVLLEEKVLGVDTANGRPAVHLADAVLVADAVVIGIGVLPNVELGEKSGLQLADGIAVDRQCHTSDPDIYAAGEVTAHPTDRFNTLRRIESWRIANEQPLVAAASMMGMPAAFFDPPWLWSDQCGLNIQTIGILKDGADYLFHGDLDAPKWLLISNGADGLPVGAAAVNDGHSISLLRRVIREGQPLPPALGDNCRPLAEISTNGLVATGA